MQAVETSDPRQWRVLLGCFGMMMCVGTAYSWSLFSRPLMAFFGWTSVQVALTFALMVFGVGVGAFAGGFLHDRFGARPVALTGASLWGLGYLLAGLGTAHFGLLWLYATYGIIGGVGGGMAYLVPGAVVTKWFPRRRGLANGVTLFGFGAGSLVYNAIVVAMPRFSRAADAANRVILARNGAARTGTPFIVSPRAVVGDVHAVMAVLAWSGVALTVIGVISALGIEPPPSKAAAAGSERERSYAPHDMLRTRAFYAIWGMVFVDCFAGLALLGNAVPIYSELTGATASVATVVYGWLSIFNGIGRLVWASLSDALGRTRSFAVAFVLEAAGIAVLAYAHAPLAVGCAFAVMLLCYGGVLAIAPAIMADFYGTRFMGEDYGYVISAVSVAGLSGPVLFSVLEEMTGSLTRAVAPMAILVALAALLPLLARKPSSTLVSQT